MVQKELFSELIKNLDYERSSNFVSEDKPPDNLAEELKDTWNKAREKLKVDAVYFVGNAPVIYFKTFEGNNKQAIADFHRSVWNQNRVPLVFAILTGDIRVYNGYQLPSRSNNLDEGKKSPRLDTLLSSEKGLWERLKVFTREAIDTGIFWREFGEYFKRDTRADQKLLTNLRFIRKELISTGLDSEYAHSLIGRSIFTLYLQDRGALEEGPYGFFATRFGIKYQKYVDLLESYEVTYQFFDLLRDHFNGNMFPVVETERERVRPQHLQLLQRLFTSDKNQLLFTWAYNFEFIPIELISSIYEEFLSHEESSTEGIYYTPPIVADFMLDQVLPFSEHNYNLRILDPACGSGIFLVEAYRRLVERWTKVNGKPKPEQLSELLKNNIYGVDKKKEALRVAAFSLYLAMLDQVEPKYIWPEVTFPVLLDINLIEADFFDEKLVTFENPLFDFVIGNPPWVSELTESAKVYCKTHKYNIGDQQIAQLFLMRAPTFCTPNGQVALLCSSKALLFNGSRPNLMFRKDFFNTFEITKVFDLSALRKLLFSKSSAPAVAVYYRSTKPDLSSSILYAAPKLTHVARKFVAIILDNADFKQLPYRQVLSNIEALLSVPTENQNIQLQLEDDDFEEDETIVNAHTVNIWKVALWGSIQDYFILQKLNTYPSLEMILKNYEKKGWNSAGGFNRKGPGIPKPFKWLDEALFLDTPVFTRYGINPNVLVKLPKGDLYYRGGNPNIFTGPRVLFKRTQSDRRIIASYIEDAAVFSTAFTAISAPQNYKNILKALTGLLNSELVSYYLFFSSASWGVEREEIVPKETRGIPFPFFDISEEKINKIVELVDELGTFSIRTNLAKEKREDLEKKLNDYIYSCFNLSEQEKQLVHETVEYTISFFHSPETTIAFHRPDVEILTNYATTFVKAVDNVLRYADKKLVAEVYYKEKSQTPMLAIKFSLRVRNDNRPLIRIIEPDKDMRETLRNFGLISSERRSRNVIHRRDVKIFDSIEDSFYILKPAENRLWTTGVALSDAEETIVELSQPVRV